MIHVKYVLMKENKNLLKLNVIIKYVQIAFNNLKNKMIMNHVHFVDNMIGMKKQQKTIKNKIIKKLIEQDKIINKMFYKYDIYFLF